MVGSLLRIFRFFFAWGGVFWVDFYRLPTLWALFYFGVFEPDEARDGGAGEVDVENAGGVAEEGEGEGELQGYG